MGAALLRVSDLEQRRIFDPVMVRCSDGCKHTILVVDNDEEVLSSLERLLRQEGYNVLTATDGEEGLKLFDDNEIALVIADNGIPGMDGAEFLSKVRENYPDTLRFMLTGHGDTGIKDLIDNGSVTRCLTKPWDEGKLKSTVREALAFYSMMKKNRALSAGRRRRLFLVTEGL